MKNKESDWKTTLEKKIAALDKQISDLVRERNHLSVTLDMREVSDEFCLTNKLCTVPEHYKGRSLRCARPASFRYPSKNRKHPFNFLCASCAGRGAAAALGDGELQSIATGQALRPGPRTDGKAAGAGV
jgi:hypothetical protein